MAAQYKQGPWTGIAEEEMHITTSLDCLYRLTDVVFAVVMVIMVVFIGKPENGRLTDAAVLHYLRSQAEALELIFITFIVIGFYWFSNTRQCRCLRRTDGVHTWLTLLFLAFVVILPFPNALSIFAPNSTVIQVFFSGMPALVGLAALTSWVYASRGHRLIRRDIDPSTVRSLTLELMVEPGVALLSIPVALVQPILWQTSFVLIPVLMILLAVLSKRQKNRPHSEGALPSCSFHENFSKER
jgi:uncharacterized membrane protein